MLLETLGDCWSYVRTLECCGANSAWREVALLDGKLLSGSVVTSRPLQSISLTQDCEKSLVTYVSCMLQRILCSTALFFSGPGTQSS